MASTSSNKQPLLIDRVLHEVVDLNGRYVTGLDVAGTNDAALIINGIGTDGAILEDVYTISRGTTAYTVNMYMSSSADYLRPNDGVFIGELVCATTVATVAEWNFAPTILAPVPALGSDAYFRALYVPKGKCLWAALLNPNPSVPITDGPIFGVQGGWY